MLGWALNEEENVAEYVARSHALLTSLTADYELILIDDGSTDNTWTIATSLAASRPWLRLYRNDRNRGSGYNTKRAISLAEKDYLFWQTVDWSYDISHLGDFLPLLNSVDILQGVRVHSATPKELLLQRSDNLGKGLISLINYSLIRFLFRLPFLDYQNVTVYPRQLIQRVQLESESSFTNPECLLKTWWAGASFHQIPIAFVKRQHGTAKGTRPRALLAAIRDITYWWLRWIVFGQRTHKSHGSLLDLKGYGSAGPVLAAPTGD